MILGSLCRHGIEYLKDLRIILVFTVGFHTVPKPPQSRGPNRQCRDLLNSMVFNPIL